MLASRGGSGCLIRVVLLVVVVTCFASDGGGGGGGVISCFAGWLAWSLASLVMVVVGFLLRVVVVVIACFTLW